VARREWPRRIEALNSARSFRRLAITAGVVSMALIPPASGADESQVDQNVRKLVAMQRAWGSATMNSAGAALALKEVSRGTLNGHTVVKYRMQASGLPTDKVYSLVLWQIGGQPQTSLSGITLDEAGTATCAGKPGTCGTPDKPNDPIDLDMLGGLGETKRVGLVASDKAANAYASVVPFRNRGTDGACILEATLVTPNAEAVMLSGSGFKPNARLDVEITSEGEKQHPAANANENGGYEGVLLPFIKGLAKGRTQASVRSANCKPVVSFSWGTGSYALQ
jgi:hypothetical protein